MSSVKLQDSKVVIKDGKVSCDCCVQSLGCLKVNGPCTNITTAQALIFAGDPTISIEITFIADIASEFQFLPNITWQEHISADINYNKTFTFQKTNGCSFGFEYSDANTGQYATSPGLPNYTDQLLFSGRIFGFLREENNTSPLRFCTSIATEGTLSDVLLNLASRFFTVGNIPDAATASFLNYNEPAKDINAAVFNNAGNYEIRFTTLTASLHTAVTMTPSAP